MVDSRPGPDKLFVVPDLRSLTILVTGATGFVGAGLVRGLLAAGVPPERLRCLVRDPARAAQMGLPAASLRIGDLTRPDSLAAAVAGAQLVFHVAGTVKASRASTFMASNVGGTQRLVAAAAAGTDRCRFVLVSSLAAAGPSVDGTGTYRPAAECRPVSAYGESKRQAELVVAGSGLPHAIVRPPFVYGPGDPGTRLLFRQASALVTAVS